MGSRRPKSAILAVFGGLEIGLRCARYAGWVCIRCIYDLRRPPGYSLSPQKSVKRIFCRQITGRSWFSVRHDAGVFRPNGRHQRNANGEKTLKPRSFGFWGGRTEKVEAKKPNRKLEMRRDRESNGSVSWRNGNAQRIALRHCRRCGVTPPTVSPQQLAAQLCYPGLYPVYYSSLCEALQSMPALCEA